MSALCKKTKLGNGATLILVPMKETGSATLLVFFPVGSRQESAALSGGSHFIEHMMFKGTKRRPDTTHISRELDSVGAEYNAFTSKDHTGYYIKVSSAHIPLALDILSDMLSNSLFAAEEMEREKGVIIEEIRMYEDNPIMQVEDLFEEALFPGTTLGRNIAGTVESMSAMRRAEVLRYRNFYYRPSKTVIAIAGKFPADILSGVKKTFGAIREPRGAKPKPFRPFKLAGSYDQTPKLKLKHKETEQVQLALGYPAYGYGDKRLPALTLLSVILGGNMSSRLFIQVRERKGLCYYIKAGTSRYAETGSLMVQSGLKKDRLKEGVQAIVAELQSLRQKGITKEELVRAQEFVKGKTVLNLEETSQVADWYARQELFLKKMLTPAQRLKEIEAVTVSAVNAVAFDIMRENRLKLGVIGPFKDDRDLRSFIA
jgi:predicted Zn-dependent peptidase